MTAILSIILSAIRLTTPIAFATMGTVIIEKSGINGLSIEGTMLFGAFGAVLGSWLSGSPWIGVLFAIGFSVLASLLRSWLCIAFQANETVSGIGINILASGLTALLIKVIWENEGKSDTVTSLADWSIPVIKNIPVIGKLFGQQNPLVYLLIITIPIIWVLMNRTSFGLRVTVAGEHPEVLSSLGIKVSRYRYLATILSGALCGIGGAYLSLGQLSFFSRDMTSGRGYMALAACIFGRWNVMGSMGGALLFGILEALQLRLQSSVRYTQFIQMIPYIITVVLLALNYRSKSHAPAAQGKVFIEQH
jgi:general nucleoside transport system permease protein